MISFLTNLMMSNTYLMLFVKRERRLGILCLHFTVTSWIYYWSKPNILLKHARPLLLWWKKMLWTNQWLAWRWLSGGLHCRWPTLLLEKPLVHDIADLDDTCGKDSIEDEVLLLLRSHSSSLAPINVCQAWNMQFEAHQASKCCEIIRGMLLHSLK